MTNSYDTDKDIPIAWYLYRYCLGTKRLDRNWRKRTFSEELIIGQSELYATNSHVTSPQSDDSHGEIVGEDTVSSGKTIDSLKNIKS